MADRQRQRNWGTSVKKESRQGDAHDDPLAPSAFLCIKSPHITDCCIDRDPPLRGGVHRLQEAKALSRIRFDTRMRLTFVPQNAARVKEDLVTEIALKKWAVAMDILHMLVTVEPRVELFWTEQALHP